MKPFTGIGDDGKTSSLGGKRIWKDSIRVETFGTIDESASAIGLARSFVDHVNVAKLLLMIEEDLYVVGANIATHINNENFGMNIPRINKMIERLEKEAIKYNKNLNPLTKFIITGGLREASFIHLARCIVRRAERRMISLSRIDEVNPKIIVYFNRLSSLLFVLARYLSKEAQFEEHPVKK